MGNSIQPFRPVQRVVHGYETSDGAGVRLTRLIGGPSLLQWDPFLLLDEIRSDEAEAYIGGFPPHPHRGFETVTYLLAGKVRHRDSAGHAGVIEAGGVQWMTAGAGVVHSEMPEQEAGLLQGFQLWVNLPAAEKMTAPRYQEYDATAVPVERRDGGVKVRVIAGTTSLGTTGPVSNLAVPIRYLDIDLPAGGSLEEAVPSEYNLFLYAFEGEAVIGGTSLARGSLALLGSGERVALEARVHSRLLLLAGRPIGEPVARQGPFVMNTQEELQQAFRDYRDGRFEGGESHATA